MPTREEILAAKTSNGGPGWTRKQLEAWGVSWPPVKGWKSRLEIEASGIDPERDRLEMKKFYQEKSGDYSY